MRFIIFLLFVVVGPFATNAKRKRNRKQRTSSKQEMHRRRRDCEGECLATHVPEEAMNCIHQCRSPACFERLYNGVNSLEPGEIDVDRALEFNSCNLAEILEARKKGRIERKRGQQDADGDFIEIL